MQEAVTQQNSIEITKSFHQQDVSLVREILRKKSQSSLSPLIDDALRRLYVAPMFARTKQESVQKCIDSQRELYQFVWKSKSPLMLLLGRAGAGKTLYGHWCQKELLDSQDSRLPLFLHLPLYVKKRPDDSYNFFEYYLRNECGLTESQISMLKQSKVPLCLILDAYDERGA